MLDQVTNTVVLYSCVFRAEDKRKARQRLTNDLLEDGSRITDHEATNSRHFLSDICNIDLPDVTFAIYQKNGAYVEGDYEIQLLLDTCFFNRVEHEAAKRSPVSPYSHFKFKMNDKIAMKDVLNESDDDDNVSSIIGDFETDFEELKELILPFKRLIKEGDQISEDHPGAANIDTKLRTRALLIPIKLTVHWTLLWVKFTKLRKLVEMVQLSPLQFPQDKLSYRSQQIIKLLVCDLLDIGDHNDLLFSYEYITKTQPNLSLTSITVRNIQHVIQGYQEFGFNVSPHNLPHISLDKTDSYVRLTRTRALPLLELKDIREINQKASKRHLKVAPSTALVKPNDTKKRNPATKIICNTNHSNTPANKRIKYSDDSKLKTRTLSSDASPSSTPQHDKLKIVVTCENLSEMKKNIAYDSQKMHVLVDTYTKTYNAVEAALLDKWSRVELFSKSDPFEGNPPFLIYGPSQIELEILKQGGIIATNTLKEKIKKYNVTLTTRTMRYLTSSRRWINQRFKLDPKTNNVFYTRDPDLIIPDYQDVPYIVLATHLTYGCISPNDTFDIIHQNWYISRKMVSFLIQHCSKCNHDP